MLDIIPSAEEMTSLVGASLYDIWNKLNALIEENMIWIVHGTKAEKPGNMNINIVGAAKPYAHYMQEKTVWGL